MPEARDRRPDGRDGWPLCFGLREPLRQRLGVLGGSPVPLGFKGSREHVGAEQVTVHFTLQRKQGTRT